MSYLFSHDGIWNGDLQEFAIWILFSPFVTALLGSGIGGLLARKAGRRQTLLMMTVPFLLCRLLLFFASEHIFPNFLAALCTGLTMGIAIVVLPLYILEVTDLGLRGRLGTFQSLNIELSSMIVKLMVLAGFSFTSISILPCVFPLVQILALPCLPESPVYLHQNGDVSKSRAVSRWLHLEDAESGILPKHSTYPRARYRVLFITLGLVIFRTLTGREFMAHYVRITWQQSVSFILITTHIASSVVSAVLMDRVGRRPLLIISSLGCAVAHAGCAGLAYLEDVTLFTNYYLQLFLNVLFTFSFSLGVGPISWFLHLELAAEPDRGWLASTAGCTHWAVTYLAVLVIGEIETLQRLPTTFTILAASCVLSVAFVLFLVPETCGKTPDLIQKELATTGFNVLGTNAARKYVALETPPTTETESNNTDPKNSSYPPISPPKLF